MNIRENFSIKDFNTFCIDIKTKYFAEVESLDELAEVLKKFQGEKVFFLGGGSNTLFVSDWDGLIVKINLKGREIIKEDEKYVYVEVFAGEIWDDFVNWAVEHNYGGVENMIMIPGTVGGGVSQNIAAYGGNITDVLDEIRIFNVKDHVESVVKPSDCGFEYRSSKFKHEWKNVCIVISAVFKLSKDQGKDLELNYTERSGRYGSLLDELNSFAKEPFSLKDVKKAVENQRNKRLPSVDDFGTCGSFFKNPVVKKEKFEELKEILDDLQGYPVENLNYSIHEKELKGDFVKIPAGRLLDELGWRGCWRGDVGVSEKHALCVVTNKGAAGKDVLSFIEGMKKSVKEKFGVELEEEVDVVS